MCVCVGALAPQATRFIFGRVQRTAHRGNCRVVCRLHAARRQNSMNFSQKKNALIWLQPDCRGQNGEMNEIPDCFCVSQQSTFQQNASFDGNVCRNSQQRLLDAGAVHIQNGMQMYWAEQISAAARALDAEHTLHESCIRTFCQFKLISRISVHASPSNCTTNAIKTMRFW